MDVGVGDGSDGGNKLNYKFPTLLTSVTSIVFICSLRSFAAIWEQSNHLDQILKKVKSMIFIQLMSTMLHMMFIV